MITEDLSQPLRKSFPYLNDPDLIEQINEQGVIREVPEGTVLMSAGQYIKYIPLLLKGVIRIVREDEDGQEHLLYYLRAGETCATSLSCCMSQKKSEIQATAEEEVTFINIPVRFLDEWMRKYPAWKSFIMQTYSQRFNELLKTIDSIAFLKMDERLLKYLKEKSRITRSTAIRITHQNIAKELNTSREVISRLLKQLEKLGKVKLSRNQIDLLDIEAKQG